MNVLSPWTVLRYLKSVHLIYSEALSVPHDDDMILIEEDAPTYLLSLS